MLQHTQPSEFRSAQYWQPADLCPRNESPTVVKRRSASKNNYDLAPDSVRTEIHLVKSKFVKKSGELFFPRNAQERMGTKTCRSWWETGCLTIFTEGWQEMICKPAPKK